MMDMEITAQVPMHIQLYIKLGLMALCYYHQ